MRIPVWTVYGLAVGLAGCGGGSAGAAVHEVRYTGALPGCGLATATLVRLADHFAFAPGDGVIVINGAVKPDGRFTATLNTQPPDKPPFLLTVQGRMEAEQVTMDYATPRCHAAATLSRVHPPFL
jgi:hypothetical protein